MNKPDAGRATIRLFIANQLMTPDFTDKKIDQTAELLKLIARPTRLRIVVLLSQQGPMSVNRLQTQLKLEESQISHYLIKMRDRGVLASLTQGKEHHYQLVDPTLAEAIQLLLNR